jgi:hypothetical protein
MDKPIDKPAPYRGATYSATDKPFMKWWKDNAPALRFGDARAAYDKAQDVLKARPTAPTTTCIEHAYGTTTRLSFQIKVF